VGPVRPAQRHLNAPGRASCWARAPECACSNLSGGRAAAAAASGTPSIPLSSSSFMGRAPEEGQRLHVRQALEVRLVPEA